MMHLRIVLTDLLIICKELEAKRTRELIFNLKQLHFFHIQLKKAISIFVVVIPSFVKTITPAELALKLGIIVEEYVEMLNVFNTINLFCSINYLDEILDYLVLGVLTFDELWIV